MSEEVPRTLWSRIRWIVLILWIVAGVKFALEFREQDDPIFLEALGIRWQASIGVYYVALVLLLVASIRGTFAGLGYGKLVQAMLLLSVLGWGVPNSIVYTTAQFKGWTHGRFLPPVTEEERERLEAAGEAVPRERSGPILSTPLRKVGSGLLVGFFTTIAGFIWNFLWMNLLIVLPRPFARKK